MVFMPHWPLPMGYIPIDEELARMKKLLALIDNPQKKLPPVIQVAGTNGKGSVSNFLKNIFISAGYKVHLYTSPHILKFNERIIVDGNEVSDELLYETLEEIRVKSEDKIKPTVFEATTVAALQIFANYVADIVIIECGMGGRLDPTNVFDNVFFSVITTISYDHTEFLGPSIETITLEKREIIKPSSKVIVAPQALEVLALIKDKCQQVSATGYFYEENYDFDINPKNLSLSDTQIIASNDNIDSDTQGNDVQNDDVQGNTHASTQNIVNNMEEFAYIDIENKEILYLTKPNYLIGDHQIINASIAICLVKNQNYFNIKEEDIVKALYHTQLIARLEHIGYDSKIRNKIQNTTDIWIDGAHNVHGAYSLSRWLEKDMQNMQKDSTVQEGKSFNQKTPYIIVIIGRTAGRNHMDFIQQFINVAHELIATNVENEPLPEKAEIILENMKKFNIQSRKEQNLATAIEYINNIEKKNIKVVICGSFYLYRDYYNLHKL